MGEDEYSINEYFTLEVPESGWSTLSPPPLNLEKVFQENKGHHYYAEPVGWDVRFGHLSRTEALEELKTELDEDRVQGILKGLAL